MSSDIARILKALQNIEEGALTPVDVKKGLNPQQKAAQQMPALFKSKDISPAIGSKTDPAHPADGYLVGENALAEEVKNVEEDMLSKVRKDLTQYLDQLADKEKSLERKARKEIQDKNPAKADDQETHEEIDEDPTEEETPDTDFESNPVISSTVTESPVKTITLEDGTCIECWGNELDGFEIRRGNKTLPSKFKSIDECTMAVDLWRAHNKNKSAGETADYVEEA